MINGTQKIIKYLNAFLNEGRRLNVDDIKRIKALITRIEEAKLATDLDASSTILDLILDDFLGNTNLEAAQIELLDITEITLESELFEKEIYEKLRMTSKLGKESTADMLKLARKYFELKLVIASEPSALAAFERYLSSLMEKHDPGSYYHTIKNFLKSSNIAKFLSPLCLSKLIYKLRFEIKSELIAKYGPNGVSLGEKFINSLLHKTRKEPARELPYTLQDLLNCPEADDCFKLSSTIKQFNYNSTNFQPGFFAKSDENNSYRWVPLEEGPSNLKLK